jgi:hypothetical protein
MKPLPARSYLILTLALWLLGVAGFSALNYAADDFGLWGNRAHVPIHGLEKTSKYLLAHRYVPKNFDGIIFGASVSDNLNPAAIWDGGKLYNLSMAGGNVTEIAAAATLYLERAKNPRLLIVNLHPYMMANHGMKSFQIHEKEYYGSLFSILPVVIWIEKTKAILGIGGKEWADSAAGWKQFERAEPHADIVEKMKDAVCNGPERNGENIIDPEAYRELEKVLNLARSRHVTIIAYFHPFYGPQKDMMMSCGRWQFFEDKMRSLFQNGETVTDFNRPGFESLTQDPKARMDLAHLDRLGAERLENELRQLVQDAMKSGRGQAR